MHGLPADADFSFLVGTTLDRMCLTTTFLELLFSDDTKITVESDLYIGEPDAHQLQCYEDNRAVAGPLAELLTKEISSVSHDTSGRLTLVFTDGWTLEFRDKDWPYESYQIYHGPDIYIV
jgi:hypothetical protein